MRLEDALKVHGCDLEPEVFKERLADLFAETNPGQTVDNLLCSWKRSRDYCKAARHYVGIRATGDDLVLETLLNMRRVDRWGLSLYSRTESRS